MKQRALLLTAVGITTVFAVLAAQQKSLLVLDWAARGPAETPPRALLIELGLKDQIPTQWPGKAVVKGAKVVHREGCRFHSSDKLVEPNGWLASSHRPMRLPPKNPVLKAIEKNATVGVVLHLDDIQPDATLTVYGKDQDAVTLPLADILAGKTHTLWNGAAAVRLVSTATPVAMGKTEDDFPAAAYAPDGALWVAYIGYHLQEERRRIEPPQLPEQPADFKAYYTPGFGDQLFVTSYRDGQWGKPSALTGPKEDIVRCAIAAEGNGAVWAIYSAQRKGNHALFARPIGKNGKPGTEQRLSKTGATRHLNPVACTDHNGSICVTYQNWDSGTATMGLLRCTAGKWQADGDDLSGDGNAWYPASAATANGEVVRAFDCYRNGNYDVAVSVNGKDQVSLRSSSFEARPSLAVDPKGRIWIAYEVGPERWGKDFGALDHEGNPLYFARTIRVACLQDGAMFAPVAELPALAAKVKSPDTGQNVESIPRWSYPQIGIDGKGRVWLTYRQKFGSRYTTHPGPYWLTFARRLDGDRWSEPVEVHHSDGLLDDRPVLLPHSAGGLRIIHNSDGRYATPETVDNQIWMSYVDLPGDVLEPKLQPMESVKRTAEDLACAKRELDAVERIRDYRAEGNGKKYQLLRGEFHRHTEISWDGGPDGSLEDMFRYAIDAAGMDWIGNGDHDNGAGREYSWWLTQKLTDAYQIKGRFTPMHSYERSVSYPHGHRNCIFAHRGVRTLPRLAEPDMKQRVAGIHGDDTKMLYRYLKEMKGICAVHTSATSMGTDWRDNDPVVEPIVEIYQGDRMSYEKEGAPRAGYQASTGRLPVNIAGWFPLGYINLALDKGYRLGFQSSSDHFSTHISYCIVLAERPDREAILDGLRKRHCYGATDDIILDVRSGQHVMGDEFKSNAAPTLQIRVSGTAPLAKVEVLRNSQVVHSYEPDKADFQATWTDKAPHEGVPYYYVRVQQNDGEIAWSSPMWIAKE